MAREEQEEEEEEEEKTHANLDVWLFLNLV